MKTLADLKRDATSGKIKFELIERYGKMGDEIPERCRGVRTVKKSKLGWYSIRNC